MKMVKGALILVAGGILTSMFAAVTGLVLARVLGPEEYGLYSVAMAVPQAFSHMFLFGADTIVTRETAKRPGELRAIWTSMIGPSLLSGMITYLVVVLTARILGYPSRSLDLIILSGLAVLFCSFATLLRAFFRGLDLMLQDVLIQLTYAVIGLVLTVGVVFRSLAASSAVQAMLGAAIVSLLVGMLLFVRRLRETGGAYRFDRDFVVRTARAALPLGLTFTLVSLNLRMDVLILSQFVSDRALGLYSAALAFMMLSRPISLSAASMLPTLSRLYASAKDRFLEVFEAGLRYTFILGAMVGISLTMLAVPTMGLFYGEAYRDAMPLLRPLGPAAAFLFMSTYLWHVLIAADQQSKVLPAIVVAMATTVLASLILVPRFGALGMTFTLMIREAVQMVWLLVQVSKITSWRQMRVALGSPLLGLAAFAAMMWPVHDRTGWSVLLYVPLCFLVAFAVLVLTRGIRKTEVDSARASLFRQVTPRLDGTA